MLQERARENIMPTICGRHVRLGSVKLTMPVCPRALRTTESHADSIDHIEDHATTFDHIPSVLPPRGGHRRYGQWTPLRSNKIVVGAGRTGGRVHTEKMRGFVPCNTLRIQLRYDGCG